MSIAYLTKRPISNLLWKLIYGIRVRIAHQQMQFKEIESFGASTFAQYKKALFRSMREDHRHTMRRKIFEKRAAMISDSTRRIDGESHAFAGVPSRCPYCNTPRMRGAIPLIIGRHGGWNDRDGKDIGLIWWHSYCTCCRNEIDHSYTTTGDPGQYFHRFKDGCGHELANPETYRKPTVIETHWLGSGISETPEKSVFIAYHIEWNDSVTGEMVDSYQRCNLPLAEDFLRYSDNGTPAFHRLCDGTLAQIK